jgi:hypothetical protein
LLFEKSVLSSQPLGNRTEVLSEDGTRYGGQEKQAVVEAHDVCRVPEQAM